jgi:hypothetical protein
VVVPHAPFIGTLVTIAFSARSLPSPRVRTPTPRSPRCTDSPSSRCSSSRQPSIRSRPTPVTCDRLCSSFRCITASRSPERRPLVRAHLGYRTGARGVLVGDGISGHLLGTAHDATQVDRLMLTRTLPDLRFAPVSPRPGTQRDDLSKPVDHAAVRASSSHSSICSRSASDSTNSSVPCTSTAGRSATPRSSRRACSRRRR